MLDTSPKSKVGTKYRLEICSRKSWAWASIRRCKIRMVFQPCKAAVQLISAVSWTRATIEANVFFSEVPQFGSLRSLPKTDLENKKKKRYRIHNPMAYYAFDEIHAKKWRNSDGFWVKEAPFDQKPFHMKSATSTVARIPERFTPIPQAWCVYRRSCD